MKSKHDLLFLLSFLLLLTIQTSAQPQLTWEKHYNGGSNLIDKVVAMTLDNDCNIYVTGISDSIGQGTNIITIKYALDGSIAWLKRFDGFDHLDDAPFAIKVSSTGNVYVCGKSTSALTAADWITIKYSPIGDTLWTRTFNNSLPGGNMDDVAHDLTINTQGNVYVTGFSTALQCAACDRDYYTIRYDSNGVILNSTNVSSGVPIQQARKIAINNANYVYVLGDEPNFLYLRKFTYDFSTYSSGSFSNFSAQSPVAKALVLDAAGNSYITGTMANDIVLRKFGPVLSNSPFYKTFRKTLTSIEGVAGMAVDASGYVYLAAFTVNTSGNKDMWLIKCNNATGDTMWTRNFVGSANGDDEPAAILLQGSGSPDILVCGYTTNGSGNKDIVLLKYSNNGNLISTQTFDMNGTDDVPVTFLKDTYNNLFVSGCSGNAGTEDFTTLKYCNTPIDSTVTNINGDYLLCQQAGAEYQWYKDGVLLSGETSQGINLFPYGNGDYFCTIQLYCCIDSTLIHSMASVEIKEKGNSIPFTIYPNPSQGIFTLSTADLRGVVTIKISSLFGQILFQEKLSTNSILKKNFDLNLPQGLYMIQLLCDERSYYGKFTIK